MQEDSYIQYGNSLVLLIAMTAIEFFDCSPTIIINRVQYEIEEFPMAKGVENDKLYWCQDGSTTQLQEVDSYISKYAVTAGNKNINNYLKIKLTDNVKAFITSELYYKGSQIVKSFYGFEKAEAAGTMSLYPFSGNTDKDFNGIYYRAAILSQDNTYQYKAFFVDFN